MNMLTQKDKSTSLIFRTQQILGTCCLAFVVGCMPISGCARTNFEHTEAPVKWDATVAPNMLIAPRVSQSESPAPSKLPEKMTFQQNYVVEIAMGANCLKPRLSRYDWVINRTDIACVGRLPTYFNSFLASLSDKHLSTLRLGLRSADHVFYFRAVPGFGQRPDIFTQLTQDTWARSFEGIDPSITMYLVEGPFVCNAEEWTGARKARSKRECQQSIPRLRLFRVMAHGIPEDVTSRLLPKPILSVSEKKFYFGKGHAELNYEKLRDLPIMQWRLILDVDAPVAKSDKRWIPGGEAHFGYVVWNGKSFELRERVLSKQWSCNQDPFKSEPCASDKETYPFIIDAK